jgi:methyltransferase family protein
MTHQVTWKDKIRAVLPWKVYWKLKRIREEIFSLVSPGDLTSLAKVYKTDKWGNHFYTPVYEKYFRHLRYKPITLLEIGVGGYAKPFHGGDSLRMWKRYFPNGKIIGIDLYDKSALQENRIDIIQGDQSDHNFLKELAHLKGPFDIIIDDGSHVQSHILASFETLFPLMKPGGIYVIEDTQTSYWPKFEGSTTDMKSAPTAMNYFIERIHAVNRAEWLEEGKPTDIPDQDIASISFYHNLIVITKKSS